MKHPAPPLHPHPLTEAEKARARELVPAFVVHAGELWREQGIHPVATAVGLLAAAGLLLHDQELVPLELGRAIMQDALRAFSAPPPPAANDLH